MTAGSATIDGRMITIEPGETILAAARRAGVDIPTLCHDDALPIEGGCRVCLVEVAGRGRPAAACHTPIEPGMRIVTRSDRLMRLRQDILSLSLAMHPPGRFHAGASGSELERLMDRLDLREPTFGWGEANISGAVLDTSHPYLRFDATVCVTCRRCLHACESIQGQFVYGIAGRGAATHLVIGDDDRFTDSDCTSCGVCADHCPSGAIGDIDRVNGPTVTRITESVCGYCGVGCRVRIEAAAQRVVRIGGVADAAVNRGHLCVKGRYAHAWQHADDRLTRPLLRVGGELRPIDWPTAIDWLARRLIAIRDEHGPDALAAITSSRSTNESAYLLQKLMRTAIGTNNVDCCARVCHSSTALGLAMTTGARGASASYDDIEQARCIVVAGANPTEAHPVIGARIKEAVLAGSKLIVIDPRRIELADYADVHLPVRPGTNVPLLNALAAELIRRQLIDRSYLDERVEGFDPFVEFVGPHSSASVAEITGVDPAAIDEAARIIGEAGPTLFVHGLGLSELTQGTDSVIALCNLGIITGSIGRPGAGMLPLRGQNNVQGNADMGAMPDQVTGYQRVDDPAVRSRLAKLWGAPLPTGAGLTVPQMIDAAADHRLHALWLQGEDVAQSEPSQRRVIEAMKQLDLLVVQDLFMCETAAYAHLVLPAAGWLENEGTFINAERRIQLVRSAIAPPGEARPDWRIVLNVGRAIGCDWRYRDPGDVMMEIAAVAPQMFGGINYDRLAGDGLQWPVNEQHPDGTPRVHADHFLRGKGRLICVDYEPSPEHVDREYPLRLITGRVLEHYNVGTMTRRTPNQRLVEGDCIELHPDDAAARHLIEGEAAVVQSRWGRIEVPVAITTRVAAGSAFLSFHDPHSHTNRLVGPHVDPRSHCPQYKLVAVGVTRRADTTE